MSLIKDYKLYIYFHGTFFLSSGRCCCLLFSTHHYWKMSKLVPISNAHPAVKSSFCFTTRPVLSKLWQCPPPLLAVPISVAIESPLLLSAGCLCSQMSEHNIQMRNTFQPSRGVYLYPLCDVQIWVTAVRGCLWLGSIYYRDTPNNLIALLLSSDLQNPQSSGSRWRNRRTCSPSGLQISLWSRGDSLLLQSQHTR